MICQCACTILQLQFQKLYKGDTCRPPVAANRKGYPLPHPSDPIAPNAVTHCSPSLDIFSFSEMISNGSSGTLNPSIQFPWYFPQVYACACDSVNFVILRFKYCSCSSSTDLAVQVLFLQFKYWSCGSSTVSRRGAVSFPCQWSCGSSTDLAVQVLILWFRYWSCVSGTDLAVQVLILRFRYWSCCSSTDLAVQVLYRVAVLSASHANRVIYSVSAARVLMS